MASLLGSLVEHLVRVVQTTRYSELASSTIILYDHLITIDDEIELVWKSSWSAGKVLFIINRYYTLAAAIFNNYALFGSSFTSTFCLRFFHWQGWTGLIACMIAEVILQMRLYALYFLNRRILAIMVATFIITTTSAAIIMGVALSKITAVAFPVKPGQVVCVPFNIPPYFYSFWIPILTFETVLCGLAVFRGYQTFNSNGTHFQSGRRLVGVLIRDSVVYFVVMFATYLTNLLVWLVDLDILEVTVGFSVAMSCVLGNRVILNVRQVNRELELERKSRSRTQHTQRPSAAQLQHSSHTAVQYVDSDTLTEVEMAQLRSMQADYEHINVEYSR